MEKRIFENLIPNRVFYYFEEISRIPHGSGNVDLISDYLAEFGRRLRLTTIQDELKNVIMIKPASKGYEDRSPIILQGHMDMVAVHRPEMDIDMRTEGLKVAINPEEGYVYAEGTSLGGDDGIAVAYALAILEDDTLKHPRLEVVITTDEETGMEGAAGIDLSMLKGNTLLNLDNEKEGEFITSCAGGVRVNTLFSLTEDTTTLDTVENAEDRMASRESMTVVDILIGGLLGGHSGEEINKGRGNSNKLAGELLTRVMNSSVGNLVYITYISGGLADNAIPRETKLGVAVCNVEGFLKQLSEFERDNKMLLSDTDPGFSCTVLGQHSLCDSEKLYEASKVVSFINQVPNGVQTMSRDVEGLVETSLNLGMLSTDGGMLKATFCVRSSVDKAKEALTKEIVTLAETKGGRCEIKGDYPGWAYRVDSPLREKMVSLYREMYKKNPATTAIHAGLECGLLAGKIKNLDCVSIGPDMKDIHTTEEKLYIDSVRRVYEFVVKLLEELS